MNFMCTSKLKAGVRIAQWVVLVVLAFTPISALTQTSEQIAELEKATGLSGKNLKIHLQLMRESPPYKNQAVQDFVTKVGKRVLAQSAHADRPYRFIVRDTDAVNAFVTGTNYVYVERGLLTSLNSEAELAAVMAHEIGHNVAQHVKNARARARRDQFFAFLASFLVGNSGLGDAISAQSTVSGFEYKREAELEADSFAAEYLSGAGYQPDQLVNALAQLRDNALYSVATSKREVAHHGLLSSHPRNDRRLREAIDDASVLPPGEGYVGREAYREMLDGITYGPNYRRTAPEGLKRYSNDKLGITFLYPSNWSFDLAGSKIVLKDPEKTAQLKITIEKTVDIKASSIEAIKQKYPDGLVDVQKIHPKSKQDLGAIGARTAQRVALAMVARNTFHFSGIAKNNVITPEQDAVFVGIIRSFSRLTPKDKTADYVSEVYFERLKPGETFEQIAKESGQDPINAEFELRVINGYYPDGEAEPGTWIKKVRKVKIEQQ